MAYIVDVTDDSRGYYIYFNDHFNENQIALGMIKRIKEIETVRIVACESFLR